MSHPVNHERSHGVTGNMSEPRWDRLLLNATLATFAGDTPYGLIERGAIALRHGRIAWIGPHGYAAGSTTHTGGRGGIT